MLALIAAVVFAFGTAVAQAFPPAFPPVTPTPVPTAPPTPKPPPPGSPTIVIPANTKITVRLTSRLSSNTQLTGQSFGFFVDRDVQVSGSKIPQCTPGTGTITFAERAGGKGKEGTLRLVFDALNLPDGTMLVLKKNEQQFKGKDQRGKAARRLLFANSVSGYDVTIAPDQEFDVEAAKDTKSAVWRNNRAAFNCPGV